MALPALIRQPTLTTVAEIATAGLPSPRSREIYSRALRRFLEWCATDRRVFDRLTVQQYRAVLIESGTGGATIRQALAAIKRLAREAEAHGLISASRLAGINDVDGVPVRGVRTGNWLTAEDTRRLLDSPDAETLIGLRDRALLAVLFGTAMRRREVCGVTVEQLALRSGRWVFSDVLRKRGKVGTVPIPGWAHERLTEWLAGAEIDTGPVFRSFDGGKNLSRPLTESGLWWIVRRRAKIIGLTLAPHDCRRTAATLALEGGADMRAVQVMLGHESVATTEQYLRALTELRDAACDRILARG